jgi:hypothetical protein
VAFSSIRMEVQQSVDVSLLQRRLRDGGQILDR